MTLSESQPGRPPDRERDRPDWGSPTRPDHLPCMPCPLPRWTQPVCVSVTSRSVQPSPMLWQVGIHDFTFEACLGFTRVTACRVAQPPYVAFVTRLRPGPLPNQAACQLPDLPTTIWVGLPPTGDPRRWGAHNIPALRWAAEGRSFVFIDIAASDLHFLKLLFLSFRVGGDILSGAPMSAKGPLHPAPASNTVGNRQ
jgi:hypothetical protein